MKKDKIFWGIAIIGAAVLILLDAIGNGLGFLNDIPIIRIVLGILCFAWAVSSLIKNQLAGVFFPLAFVFMLFEREIARLFDAPSDNIVSNWIILLCALLLTIGTGLIFKPKPNYADSRVPEFNTHGGESTHRDSRMMGSAVKYVDCNGFTYQIVENKLGAYNVYFENIGSYVGDALLEINNDLGSMTIHVPRAWLIKTSISNNLGSVSVPSKGNPQGPVIEIRGCNNLGSVSIISE